MGYRWGGIQCTYRAGSSIPSSFRILILRIVQLSGWSILQAVSSAKGGWFHSGMLQTLDSVRLASLIIPEKNHIFLMDWNLKVISFLCLCEPKLKATKYQICTYKMWVYSNHKMSFQFSLPVEETSKMQACKTFSSMHGQAWHFIYKKTIRKGSNMYKNHRRTT